MIDIRVIRENPEIVKESQRKRKASTELVDEVLLHDKKWREISQKADGFKAERNKINEEIIKLKKSGKDISAKIKEVQKITEQIKQKDEELEKQRAIRDDILLQIPNILHESVPSGKDSSENTEVRSWGKIPIFKFTPKDHIDLGLSLDLFDIERAAKTSGARFYFLKNEAVQLELAIAQFALDYLAKQGFAPLMPPNLVNGKTMYGVGMLPASRDEIYKIENDDLYLILTSEHAIGGFHMDEILESSELPKKYAGFSPCYRTEAGAHGRDTKGIFRVHQFNKIEMFIFCEPEKSWEEHELLIKHAEALVQKLGLPYRVMNICTGDIGSVAAKKYDVEAWMPGQNSYRELISCSNCTDFQARRLNARCRSSAGEKTRFMHTLNSTALAIGRTMVAILENYQNEKGEVEIPKALHPYLSFKKISLKKK